MRSSDHRTSVWTSSQLPQTGNQRETQHSLRWRRAHGRGLESFVPQNSIVQINPAVTLGKCSVDLPRVACCRFLALRKDCPDGMIQAVSKAAGCKFVACRLLTWEICGFFPSSNELAEHASTGLSMMLINLRCFTVPHSFCGSFEDLRCHPRTVRPRPVVEDEGFSLPTNLLARECSQLKVEFL